MTRERASLIGVFGFGAFVCFWDLGSGLLHPDELTYSRAGQQIINGELRPLKYSPFVPAILGVSQWLFGDSLTGMRMLPALVGFATGGVLYAFGRRVAGVWAGLAAALVWFALPFPLHPTRINALRFGMLDTFAASFLIAAAYCAYRWRDGRKWVVLTGLAAGLAVASKPTAAVALPLLLLFWRDWRGVLVAGSVAAVVGLAPYLMYGTDFWPGMERMLSFQRLHQERGHPVIIQGEVTDYPPWWVHLYFWHQAVPWGITLGMGSLLAAGIAVYRRASLYVLLPALALFAFLSLYVSFALNHYGTIWHPFLALLVGLGLVAAWRWRVVAGVVALAFVVVAGAWAVKATFIDENDWQRVARFLVEQEAREVLVTGRASLLAMYLPETVKATSRDAVAPDHVVVVHSFVARKGGMPEQVENGAPLVAEFGNLRIYTIPLANR